MTTSFHVKTEVLFGEHKPDIIDWYLSTGEYKDKAGGYGTQAIGAFLIKEIRGCYYNVMGLPIHKLIEEIMKLTSKDAQTISIENRLAGNALNDPDIIDSKSDLAPLKQILIN